MADKEEAKESASTSSSLLLPVLLPEEAIFHILTYLDVRILIQTKQISRSWKQICINVINSKCLVRRGGPKPFETNQELRSVIDKYIGKRKIVTNGTTSTTTQFQITSEDAEEIATIYGWPIGNWNVSQITNFSCCFKHKPTFNEYLGTWNVSNATNMNEMFAFARSFQGKDLSNWDTSNVTTMEFMFVDCVAFNSNISNWDTSNVTSMFGMFMTCRIFNQNLSHWNVSNVTNMKRMFCFAKSFQGLNLSVWDFSNVTTMEGMLVGAISFENEQISVWNISNDTIRQSIHTLPEAR